MNREQRRALMARARRTCDQDIQADLAYFEENGITPTPALISQVARRRARQLIAQIETEIHEGRCPEMWETPTLPDEVMLGKIKISRVTYLQICIMAEHEWLEYLREMMKIDTSKYPSRDRFVPELNFTYHQVFYPAALRERFHQWLHEEYMPRFLERLKQQEHLQA